MSITSAIFMKCLQFLPYTKKKCVAFFHCICLYYLTFNCHLSKNIDLIHLQCKCLIKKYENGNFYMHYTEIYGLREWERITLRARSDLLFDGKIKSVGRSVVCAILYTHTHNGNSTHNRLYQRGLSFDKPEHFSHIIERLLSFTTEKKLNEENK